MPTTSRFPWPQRTTATAGVLLLVSAVLLLLDRGQAALPITDAFVVPLSGPAVSFAATITEAAGFIVAALGIAGEVGIAADSRLAKIALVAWGVRDLVLGLFAGLPVWIGAPIDGLGLVGLGLSALFAAAAIVAVVLVLRARVLSGLARWALLPAAAVLCIFTALNLAFLPPFTGVALAVETATAPLPIGLLDPALTALIAVALLLWSRTEAVKLISDAW